MEHLAPGIILFSNVFPESANYLKKIYEEKVKWEEAIVHSNGTNGVNTSSRYTDTITLPNYLDSGSDTLTSFSRDFHNETQGALNEYFTEYGHVIDDYQPSSLLRYGKGQYFKDHIDDSRFNTRRLSLTYYIDEDYEGGEIEFPRLNLKIRANKHQLLVFPSNFVYNHIVHEVTSGLRHVIVRWMS